jgi:hypothetical protein
MKGAGKKKAVHLARPLINPMNISKNEIFSGIYLPLATSRVFLHQPIFFERRVIFNLMKLC